VEVVCGCRLRLGLPVQVHSGSWVVGDGGAVWVWYGVRSRKSRNHKSAPTYINLCPNVN